MTLLAIIFLFVRTTLLFAGTLGVLRAVRHSSAATRHWICLVSLVGSLLLPLTLLAPRGAIALRVDALSASLLAATPVRANLQPVTVVCAIWLGGVALLLFRLACGHWSVHQIALRGIAAGIVDGVRVRSAEVPVPLVTGLFRPTILLPENASEWHVNHRDAALRHELAHLTRKDLWSSFAASLACALWWFHPLAWKLAARQQTEQESACDDAVIAGGLQPADYAEALVAAASPLFRFTAPGSTMFTRNDLTERIQRLANYTPPEPATPALSRRIAICFAVALLALTLVGPGTAQNGPYKAGGDVTSPQALHKVNPAYPPDAKAAKIQGTVVLRVVISAAGTPDEVTVQDSVDPSLDAAAVEAVRQWTFSPGLRKGEPVAVEVAITINFQLK